MKTQRAKVHWWNNRREWNQFRSVFPIPRLGIKGIELRFVDGFIRTFRGNGQREVANLAVHLLSDFAFICWLRMLTSGTTKFNGHFVFGFIEREHTLSYTRSAIVSHAWHSREHLLPTLFILVRITLHLFDLLFRQAGRLLDLNLRLLLRTQISGRHVQNPVGIQVERNLDLRHPTRSRRNTLQIKLLLNLRTYHRF